jgi:hypothetical protein
MLPSEALFAKKKKKKKKMQMLHFYAIIPEALKMSTNIE